MAGAQADWAGSAAMDNVSLTSAFQHWAPVVLVRDPNSHINHKRCASNSHLTTLYNVSEQLVLENIFLKKNGGWLFKI